MRLLVKLTAMALLIIALFMLFSVASFTIQRPVVPLPLLISTIVLWIVTIGVGPLAARWLWRFERRGWAFGLLVFGVGLLYFGGCLVIRAPGSHIPSLVAHSTVNLLGLTILGLPTTRRALR